MDNNNIIILAASHTIMVTQTAEALKKRIHITDISFKLHMRVVFKNKRYINRNIVRS